MKKSKTRIFKNCSVCKNDFTSEDEIEYIRYREYAGRRYLCTPSKNLIKLISNFQDIIYHILKENLEVPFLKDIIKTSIYSLVNFDFIKCNTHKIKMLDYLINTVIRFMNFNYCKVINKILSGRRQVDDEEDKV